MPSVLERKEKNGEDCDGWEVASRREKVRGALIDIISSPIFGRTSVCKKKNGVGKRINVVCGDVDGKTRCSHPKEFLLVTYFT